MNFSSVICAEVNEDSSMLAVGLNNSIIRIWSLTPQKLKAMKHQSQLMEIDKEAGKYSKMFFFKNLVKNLRDDKGYLEFRPTVPNVGATAHRWAIKSLRGAVVD